MAPPVTLILAMPNITLLQKWDIFYPFISQEWDRLSVVIFSHGDPERFSYPAQQLLF